MLCLQVQNIPTQNRKRPLADETEKDEVKVPKQDPEDEPLSMLGQNQEDDSFFVESADDPPTGDDGKYLIPKSLFEYLSIFQRCCSVQF